jgi:DNA mismatch repair protein MutL
MTIATLPPEVVHLIAAGEVIDSLAAVVRELVENSIDAGATRININISPETWQVRVADNGKGMSFDDLHFAAFPHSTSKICRSEDLWKITSLGFRGEALHSIATLADLEIISRASLDDNGWLINYNSQGDVINTKPMAIACGTIINVGNLFASWLGKREGMPSVHKQLRSIQSLIYQFALCHPHITWKVEQNNRPWLSVSPATNAQYILTQIIREVKPGDLQYFNLNVDVNSAQKSQIQLVLGLPDRLSRHRPDWVRVAVNGRMIKSVDLEQTILSTLMKTLPRDRFPICFVHLQIPPDQVDWTRQPTKTEIYLQNLSFWQDKIIEAINNTLSLNRDFIGENSQQHRVGELLKVAELQGGYHVQRKAPEITKKSELGLVELKAVAQVHNTYIVAEHSHGIWLIEQHIAHERVLYEQICDRWQIVPVERAIILENLSTSQVEQIERIGLNIEIFGDNLWAIRSVPAMLKNRADCGDAILELSRGGDLQTAQVAIACRTAIRNGTPLTLTQMQSILDQWQKTNHPRTCPHGRPIFLTLEETSLAKFFRRQWVIGKSHGI